MLFKIEKTPGTHSYIINGNLVRYFILCMLALFAAMYFFATWGLSEFAVAAFYCAVALGALFFMSLIPIWIRTLMAALKGKKVKRTLEARGMGWGKSGFIYRIEIEQ